MRQQWIFRSAVTVVVSAALGGCVTQPPQPVKTVLADKSAHLESEFNTTKLPPSVLQTIQNADLQPSAFKRLDIVVTTETQTNGGAQPSHFENHVVVENLGHGLMRSMDQISSNDIDAGDRFMLSYRNIVTLRSQSVNLNAKNAGLIWAVKSFDRFEPVSQASDIDYSYESGSITQIANFQSLEMRCSFGKTYSASALNPKIEGNVREMTCENHNSNGAVTSHNTVAYLDKYGYALLLKRENTASKTSFTVKDFLVQ